MNQKGSLDRLYEERMKRYVTAMRNGQPDRVPIRLFAQEFAAKYAGRSNHEVACDYHLAFDVTRECAAGLGCDATMANAIVNWFGMSKAIGWKGIAFPGIDTHLETVTQWTEPADEENAYMKADEYDEFIDDPTAFLLNVWLPRFTDHINPVGGQVTFEHNMALISGSMSFLEYMGSFGRYAERLRHETGVVSANAGTLKAPLDIIADKLRGYVNLCYDLFERPDKVLAACEAMMPHLLASALAGADPDKNVPVTIWMHRGGVPFVSEDVFNNVYWATLKPIVEEIWAHGHQVLFYAEGEWDRHLEKFAELPEGSIIYHIDKGDIFKAKKVLGGKFCLSGGIPNSLLSYGSREEVVAACKEVIDGVAQDGGYIMDASALIMDDAKVENVQAMIDFTLDYGVYNQSSSSGINGEFATFSAANTSAHLFKEQKRKPGICIPWEERRGEFRNLTGNAELVRTIWETVDNLGYIFIWTNLTW